MTLPKQYGNRLLIALSNNPSTFDLIRTVARDLSEPDKMHIMLMHYLLPIGWEHGGGDSPEAQAQRARTEEIARQNERYEEEQEERYFDRARKILEEAGVPACQIKTSERWDSMDAAHAVLDELRSGSYSAVVVGQHHHNILDALFSTSMADFLQNHAKNVMIWSVPQP